MARFNQKTSMFFVCSATLLFLLVKHTVDNASNSDVERTPEYKAVSNEPEHYAKPNIMKTTPPVGNSSESLINVRWRLTSAETIKGNEEKLKMEEDLLKIKPPKFMKVFKNPCWISKYIKTERPPSCDKYNDICGSSNKTHGWILRCLPAFYLIGVPKGATSDMYNRIEQHPDITQSTKQTHFWARERYGHCDIRYDESLCRTDFNSFVDFYSKQASELLHTASLQGAGDQTHTLVFGEGSPTTFMFHAGNFNVTKDGYFDVPRYTNPYFINHFQPNAKYILLLRDPVTRTYSSYNHFTSNKDLLLPKIFHEKLKNAIDEFNTCTRRFGLRSCVYTRMMNQFLAKGTSGMRLYNSMYATYLEDWLRIIDRNNLLIIRTEDFSSDIKSVLRRIFNFLDLTELDKDSLDAIANLQRTNVRPKTIKPMWEESRRLLTDFFRPHNAMLSDILQDERFMWDEFH